MDWSGTSDFLSIVSDLDLGHARSLVGSVAPRFVVVRAEQASAAVRDDEDEQAPARSGFFVVDAGAISGLSGSTPMGATIGDFVRERYAPALAIDTDDGWLAAEGTVGTGADVHAVLLDDDGIVTEVVPNLRIVDAAGHEPFDAPGVLPNQRWRHLHKAIADFVVPGITAFTVSGGDGVAAEDRGGGAPAAVPGVEDGEAMALEVHFADTVRLGDTAPLLVSLTLGAGGTGSAPITARSGELLEIMVSPTAGFTLVDEPVKKMTVVVNGETLPVKFDLLADVEGKGAAKVYVFREGKSVASLAVSASIVITAVEVAGDAPTTVRFPAIVKAIADLDLMVLRESLRGGHALRYRLTSADSQATSDFGPNPLDGDPSRYVHAAFREIQELSAGRWFGSPERTRLERIGADLYESLVPPDLQEVLWKSDRVRSFLVQTESRGSPGSCAE